ncbi:uncharacterized protein LOC69397 isoform X2 [Mus musculus]|uniref:uncharacterized protein LOC69397 isoform X2 n=1 Tax=Mus musculus TaxID=10090 RepID=UPI0003D77337|nr:uncharacterized protein LOC69397 isoform X2 [Mus musculus]|eukprot:XP_006496318.1 PREDICTED: uncharacterized protein LOC69397 isoform X2 [Mus musculus]
MVVVRSAKFCYRLLTLLAGAYLPRAPLPLPQKAPPPSIPATPTRPAQYGWSRQQRRDLGYPDGEEEAYLEELEEESDMFEEEETEALNEDGSKEAHNNVRTSHKVSLRSIASMTDEERFNMRIKKFGITSKEFRKSPVASCFGLPLSTGKENADMEKKRRRLERFGLS